MSTGLAETDGVQQRPSGVWDYVSASRLNCWLACPLKLRFRYIDRIEAPTSPAMFLGSRVHAGLAVYYRHRQLGITLAASEIASRIATAWQQEVASQRMAFQSRAEEEQLKQQASELATAYLAHVSPEEPRPLAVETSLEAPLVDPCTGEDLGIPLVGILDLVLGGPAGPTIIDFKTSSRSSEPVELLHEVQLSSYAYLFRRLSPVMEAGLEIRSIIKTKTPKVEFHAYPARGEVHFRRLFAVIRAYLDDLDAGRFVYRPGLGCGACEYRDGACRAWEG